MTRGQLALMRALSVIGLVVLVLGIAVQAMEGVSKKRVCMPGPYSGKEFCDWMDPSYGGLWIAGFGLVWLIAVGVAWATLPPLKTDEQQQPGRPLT